MNEDGREKWAKLPERIRPEEMTTARAVEPAADSTPEVDLVQYWSAREQSRLG
ncbi:MAG TPA: hypothetical protein VJX66_14250 [Amycolatopsis sp.]|nr:hypothetical protein [Amycolatopsis sp.]